MPWLKAASLEMNNVQGRKNPESLQTVHSNCLSGSYIHCPFMTLAALWPSDMAGVSCSMAQFNTLLNRGTGKSTERILVWPVTVRQATSSFHCAGLVGRVWQRNKLLAERKEGFWGSAVSVRSPDGNMTMQRTTNLKRHWVSMKQWGDHCPSVQHEEAAIIKVCQSGTCWMVAWAILTVMLHKTLQSSLCNDQWEAFTPAWLRWV